VSKEVAMNRVVALLLVLLVLGQSGVVLAQEGAAPREPTGFERASLAVASGLASGIYIPAKGLLCLFGGAASLLTYVSSGKEAQRAQVVASCEGSWVITPDILLGRKPLVMVHDIPGVPVEP
jgi:hypothetical protein